MLFAGSAVYDTWGAGGAHAANEPAQGILLEAASWINQRRTDEPIQIKVTARSFDQAKRLSDDIIAQLTPIVLGDAARVQAITDVQPDAPEVGTVTLSVSALR